MQSRWWGALAVCAIACEGTAAVDGGGRRDAGRTSFDAGPGFDAASLPPIEGWAPLAWEDCEGGGRALEAGPDDYRDVLATIEPGDTLRLRPGSYARGLPLTSSGTAGQCIVIEALDPNDRPLFLGSDAFNIVAVHGASWIKVRNLDVDGMGLAGFGVASQGGDAMPTHHVVIEGLHITGLGADQQIVGISTKSPAWDWVIRGNTIEGAGTGLYLGNSDGTAPFIRGLIELNTVLDTIGYSMEIKHQPSRPDVPEIPTGASETIIRHNVFVKGGNSSTDDLARPNLLLGHFPTSGAGVTDRYLVYGNFFFDNPTENLMQAEGNVAIYANVFVNPRGGALNVQPHNDLPRTIDVFFNTVVASGTGIRVAGGDPSFAQRVRYNAVFSPTPIDADDAIGDVTGADASSMLVDPDAALGALDLHPLAGALSLAIDPSELPDAPASDRDFDGRLRPLTYVGAYEGAADATAVPLVRQARPYGD